MGLFDNFIGAFAHYFPNSAANAKMSRDATNNAAEAWDPVTLGIPSENSNSAQSVQQEETQTPVESGYGWLSELYGQYKQDAENAALTQRNFNHSEAELNRNWQEMMSNTAHQREIADLEAAGINKLLTIDGGSGASTPSGSAASAAQQQVSDAGVNGIVQIVTQSMRDIQTEQDRLLNEVQFDKSLSEEQRQFKERQIQGYIEMGLNFVGSIAGMVTGNVVSSANAKRYADASIYSANSHYAGIQYSSNAHYAASKYSSDNRFRNYEVKNTVNGGFKKTYD